MDIENYRREIAEQIDTSEDYATAETPRALEALTRKRGSAAERAELVARLDLAGEDLEPIIEQLTRTLRDHTDAVTVRLAALRALQRAEFLSIQLDPHRARITEALRAVMEDASPKIRDAALESLAAQADPVAQEVLVRAVESGNEPLVPTARAIQLLSYDDHSAATPVVLGRFDSLDDRSRLQAIRVLAADPSAESLLQRLVLDKGESTEIRQRSAASLRALNPETFRATAEQVIADPDDYAEIKASCLTGLASDGSYAAQTSSDFVRGVRELRGKAASTNLKRSASRYLAVVDGTNDS